MASIQSESFEQLRDGAKNSHTNVYQVGAPSVHAETLEYPLRDLERNSTVDFLQH